MVDIQRGTTGVNLPAEVSNEIWQNVLDQSAVQRTATQVALPGNGVAIDIITGEAVANWVEETAEKPVSRPTVGSKTIKGHTVAVIVPFSNQFRRDKNGLYQAMTRQLPLAIARKFDRTVLGYDAAPAADFDTLAASPTVSIDAANTGYTGLLTALQTIAAAGGELTHVLGSSALVAKLLGQLDTTGRPIFNGDLGQTVATVLGVPLVTNRNVTRAAGGVGTDQILGVAGDWAGSAFWGQVGGITVSISDQATINDGGTQINLWQRDMFAVRVETELGFAVKDDDRFVRLTGTPGA